MKALGGAGQISVIIKEDDSFVYARLLWPVKVP
jgi:hypothetical protein